MSDIEYFLDGEKVALVERLLPWQKRGLFYTASGYGAAIPTHYVTHWRGRWRRVYCTIYSNSGSAWVRVKGEKIFLR